MHYDLTILNGEFPVQYLQYNTTHQLFPMIQSPTDLQTSPSN